MFRRILARLGRRQQPSDDEIARELRDHLDLETETAASDGLGVASRDVARRRFGNVAATREAVHDVWRWAWAEQLVQDVRHGARALRRAPDYSIAVAVTLALGIGAAAASFCFFDAVHRPFPFLVENQLVSLVQRGPRCPGCDQSSPAAFLALQTRARSLTPVASSTWRTTIRLGDASEIIDGFRVSPGTFPVIGATFARGRGFAADAGQPGAPKTAVLSYRFWHDRFNASPGVIDSTITLGGASYVVVGVLQQGVVFPMEGDVYAPLVFASNAVTDYASHYLDVFARLSPGSTFMTAAVEAKTIGAKLALESPTTDSGLEIVARPIDRYHTDDVAVLDRILAIAALLVFVAACMSAANLALSRATARRGELALRTALGVGRARMTRHLITEAALLSVVAAVIGIGFAKLGVDAMRTAIPPSLSRYVPGWAHAGIEWRTVLFTVLAAVVATIVFAAAPAIRATRTDIAAILSDGGRTTTVGVRGTRTRGALVVIEVGIALVLLTAATLLARSVRNMIAGDPGVRRDGVLTMHMSLPATMRDSAMRDFYRRLDRNLRETPNVVAAGMTSTAPLSNNWWGTGFDVPGRVPTRKDETLTAMDQRVTPDYLKATGVRVTQGRAITAADVSGAPRVVVVNELLASTMWPNRDPIGRPIVIDSVTWTIVGVAANVHHGGLDEPVQFELYRSVDQAVQRAGDLAVQTDVDPAAMRDVVRRVVAKTDPSAAVGEMMTMRELEARHVAVFRMSAGMLMVLAAVTMVIATVGLYGLIAYGVAQRTREIGLRMALGARPIDVLMRIGAGAAWLAIVGVAFGIAGAAAFARLLNAMLYGVTASDPATFVGAAVGLLTVALVAALVPAWRASRLDPTIALRD